MWSIDSTAYRGVGKLSFEASIQHHKIVMLHELRADLLTACPDEVRAKLSAHQSNLLEARGSSCSLPRASDVLETRQVSAGQRVFLTLDEATCNGCQSRASDPQEGW